MGSPNTDKLPFPDPFPFEHLAIRTGAHIKIVVVLVFRCTKIVQWSQNAGRCGVCGDAYHLEAPRPHEAGGVYAKGIISKFYTVNQVRCLASFVGISLVPRE